MLFQTLYQYVRAYLIGVTFGWIVIGAIFAFACYKIVQGKGYPEETCFFTGHENAQQTLKFALSLDPKNEQLKLLQWGVRHTLLKSKNKPSTPTCLHDEMLVNPFFRV